MAAECADRRRGGPGRFRRGRGSTASVHGVQPPGYAVRGRRGSAGFRSNPLQVPDRSIIRARNSQSAGGSSERRNWFGRDCQSVSRGIPVVVGRYRCVEEMAVPLGALSDGTGHRRVRLLSGAGLATAWLTLCTDTLHLVGARSGPFCVPGGFRAGGAGGVRRGGFVSRSELGVGAPGQDTQVSGRGGNGGSGGSRVVRAGGVKPVDLAVTGADGCFLVVVPTHCLRSHGNLYARSGVGGDPF